MRFLPRRLAAFPISVWVGLVLIMLLSWLTGPRHDYLAYQVHWQHILDGGRPWLDHAGQFNGNAYGPAYWLLAWLWAIHPLVPKLLFTAASCWFVLWRLEASRAVHAWSPGTMKQIWWLVLSPYMLIMCVYYCDLDVLVAILIGVAIVAEDRQRDWIAAGCLSIATLIKFFPIVLVPFFVFGRRRFNWRIGALVAAFTLAGFGWAYHVWGDDMLIPLRFATERHPTYLSIFRSLEYTLWPQAGSVSIVATAVSGLSLFGWHLRRRLSTEAASLLALLAVFTWYKVGHHQFYLNVMVAAGLWLAAHGSHRQLTWAICRPVVWTMIWLSVFSLFYIWSGSFNFGFWRHVEPFLGFVHFLLFIYLAAMVLRQSRDCSGCRQIPAN